MAQRTEAQVMVRGMGMGMKVLELLEKQIRENNGNPEVLAFLTRPRFKKNLDEIAYMIANCDWRIPISEMRFLAEKAYREEFEFNPDLLEEARNLWWWSPLIDLGIPYQVYCDDPNEGPPAIPDMLRKQLHDRPMSYPLFAGKKDIVMKLDLVDHKTVWKPGERIDGSQILSVGLVEARYFDLEH